jgi:hypothetical protein
MIAGDDFHGGQFWRHLALRRFIPEGTTGPGSNLLCVGIDRLYEGLVRFRLEFLAQLSSRIQLLSALPDYVL